jgi:hypothetical protein
VRPRLISWNIDTPGAYACGKTSLFSVALLFALTTVTTARQDGPDLSVLLDRAATYVARYMDVMSNLNVDESYSQDVLSAMRFRTAANSAHRELRSDVVLVRVGPPLEWRTYRDVFELNGAPVRDRADRLAKLILEPVDNAFQQAERIAAESARFNISNVGRTLNEPGLPLIFLQRSLQPRFQFTLDKREGSAWIVRYEETTRPTLFRHNRTTDNPATGRFWIADNGEVVKTEMIVKPAQLNGTFTTAFRHENAHGIAVPIELREQVMVGADPRSPRIDGIAKYSNYRKFQVTTEEGVRTDARP